MQKINNLSLFFRKVFMKNYKIFLFLICLIFTTSSFAMQNCYQNSNIIYVYEQISDTEVVFPLRRIPAQQDSPLNTPPAYKFIYQTRDFRNTGIKQTGVIDAKVSFENLINAITTAIANNTKTAQILLQSNSNIVKYVTLDENDVEYLKNIWLAGEQLLEKYDQILIKNYFLEKITNLTLI